MTRMIILLSLMFGSGICFQECEDIRGIYLSYAGELTDGQSPDQLCRCVQVNLNATGVLDGRKYDCVESEVLETLNWEDATEDQLGTVCTNCFNGCKPVITNNPDDSAKICDLIRASDAPPVTDVGRTKRALRFYCYLVIEFRWFRVRVYFRCKRI